MTTALAYVGRVVATATTFYKEINPSTLSGAIDVVVVRQKNGDLVCSPFHVRFGKLKLLRPSEKVVEISVNGKPTDFLMKLGEAGEAYFVVETENPVPSEYATSPIPSPTEAPDEHVEPLDLGAPAAASDDGLVPAGKANDDLHASYVSAHGSDIDIAPDEFSSPTSPLLPISLDPNTTNDGSTSKNIAHYTQTTVDVRINVNTLQQGGVAGDDQLVPVTLKAKRKSDGEGEGHVKFDDNHAEEEDGGIFVIDMDDEGEKVEMGVDVKVTAKMGNGALVVPAVARARGRRRSGSMPGAFTPNLYIVVLRFVL
ncbi:hypothetical protein HK102_001494 [Quaeritorhiza haematococci]|nr:hypothetical protein HK102_001494 [Quaeritorhiza haematococci]